MGSTVTGKLNKSAQQFQAGESTGFGIRIGVKYYDRKTKTSEWTNYKAVLFAKAPGQIQFLQENLIEGAIVEISGDKQKIEVYEGQSGPVYSIEILDAKIGHVSSGIGGAPSPQQQAYAQPTGQQQAPQQQGYQPAPPPQNQPQGAHQQGNGYAQSQPMNAPAQQTVASHSNQAPAMDDFSDDIPFN
jgi:single-strand DNA-binding protein